MKFLNGYKNLYFNFENNILLINSEFLENLKNDIKTNNIEYTNNFEKHTENLEKLKNILLNNFEKLDSKILVEINEEKTDIEEISYNYIIQKNEYYNNKNNFNYYVKIIFEKINEIKNDILIFQNGFLQKKNRIKINILFINEKTGECYNLCIFKNDIYLIINLTAGFVECFNN